VTLAWFALAVPLVLLAMWVGTKWRSGRASLLAEADRQSTPDDQPLDREP
jgi:hypothetical protein